MKITQQNIDDLTATITISIEKADYAGNVENVLKNHRKTTQVPGFRKGHAPMGMIKKQYGMAVQMDEINKLISSQLQKHLDEADFKILGEPLPSEKQETLDFDNGESFDFLFDIGILPEIKLELSEKDSIVSYEIKPEASAIDAQITQFTSQFAEMTNPEIVEDKDMVRGDIAQVDAKGNIVEGGISKEAAVLSPERLIDADVTKAFMGAKVGAEITFNPSKAINETELPSFLGTEEGADAEYKMTVTEIVRYVDAEINEDLFTKVFPNEEIKDEAAFRARIEEDVKKNLANDSNMRFEWDAREYVVAKLQDVAFPEAFLKRWITVSNENKEDFDAAKLDADFSKVVDDVRWQLATSSIAETAELKVDAEDPMKAAMQMAAQQFAMYGMGNLPEEYLVDYAKKMLEDQNQAEQIINKVMSDKVVEYIKSSVKLKNKKVSMDDFKKLYEQA